MTREMMAEKTLKPAVVTRRTLDGPVAKIAMAVAIFGAVYHLYNAGFGSQSELQLRSMHWAFISFLAYLMYPARQRSPRHRVTVLDGVLAVAAATCGLYIYITWMDIADRQSQPSGLPGFRVSISRSRYCSPVGSSCRIVAPIRRNSGWLPTTSRSTVRWS